MEQERHCWQFGPLEFCATRDTEGSWLVYGMVGAEEVLAETYFHGTLYSVKNFTVQWAFEFAKSVQEAAEEYRL